MFILIVGSEINYSITWSESFPIGKCEQARSSCNLSLQLTDKYGQKNQDYGYNIDLGMTTRGCFPA